MPNGLLSPIPENLRAPNPRLLAEFTQMVFPNHKLDPFQLELIKVLEKRFKVESSPPEFHITRGRLERRFGYGLIGIHEFAAYRTRSVK